MNTYPYPYPGPTGPVPPVRHKSPPIFRFILLYGTAAVMPITLLMCLLVGLVFSHQEAPEAFIDDTQSDIYYINYSISNLLTVSSWCGTIAVLIAGFITPLFSYTFATFWNVSSQRRALGKLPTPLQFALCVQIFNFSGVAVLWKLFSYLRAKPRSPTPGLLQASGLVLATSLIFGWGIAISDVWLHAASSSMVMTSSAPVSAPALPYGRGLSPFCIDFMDKRYSRHDDAPGRSSYPCNLNPAAAVTFLMNETESISTLFNVSTNNTVRTSNSYALLLPSLLDLSLDYTASTFGAKTECHPISRICNLHIVSGVQTLFDCGSTFPAMKGNMENITSYEKYLFTKEENAKEHMIYGTTQNPVRFAAAAYLQSVSPALRSDPEIVSTMHSQRTAIFDCKMEFVEVTYKTTNNTITDFAVVRANDTIALIFSAFGSAQTYYTGILDHAMMVAALEDDSQSMADTFARSASETFVALFASATAPIETQEQRRRVSKLIALFPKAPLWAMTVFCAIYVLFAIIIVVIATVFAVADPETVAHTQLRLSVESVASRALEPEKSRESVRSVAEMFTENDTQAVSGHMRYRKVLVAGNEKGGMDVHAIEPEPQW